MICSHKCYNERWVENAWYSVYDFKTEGNHIEEISSTDGIGKNILDQY